MRLLVLGGSGAIGSAVLRHAAGAGMQAHAALRPDSMGVRLECGTAPIVQHRLALHDADALQALLQQIQPDALVAAAFPRGYAATVPQRRSDAVSMLDNLLALFGALARVARPPRVVLLGSATVYGPGAQACGPRAVLQPQSFRGALKAAESVMARRLAQDSGVDLVELRLFTGYGPFEQRERFIPQLLRAAIGFGDPIHVASQPRWRDWVHYDDVAHACLQALHCAVDAEAVFDLCRGERHSLQETAARLEHITGRRLVCGARDDIADHYGDIGPGTPPDRSRFDWRARIDLDTGLARCWQWAGSDAGRRWLQPEGSAA